MTVNLLTRHLVNELYFSMDDVAAAKAGDKAAAKKRGRAAATTSTSTSLINLPGSSKVGDKFAKVEVAFEKVSGENTRRDTALYKS